MSDLENTKIEEEFWEMWEGTIEEGEAMDLEQKWEWIRKTDYLMHKV